MSCQKALCLFAAFALVAVLLSGCAEPQPAADTNQQQADQNLELGTDQNLEPGTDQNQQDGQPPEPYIPPQPSPAEIVSAAIETCKNQPTGLKIDACLVEAAKQHNTGEPCNHLLSMPADLCYADAAAYNGNAALCADMLNTRRRQNCYYSSAEKSLIPGDCAGIDANAERRDSCYMNVAEKSENETACKYISVIADRDSCYRALAGLKNDSTICGKVSTMYSAGAYNRDLCYLDFTRTKEVCGLLLNAERRDECYDSVARSGSDAGTCRLVSDKMALVECLDYVARQLDSMELCDEVADLNSALGQGCYDYLAESAQSLETCSRLGTYGERNDCYYNLAISQNSEGICAEIIGDAALRDGCYKEIGIAKADPAICEKIRHNNFEVIDACYLAVGTANKDTEVCELLHFASNYIECFAEVADTEGLTSVCATMQRHDFPEIDYDPEQHCYKEYAVKVGDSAYCEWVGPADLRAECVAEIG